MLVAVALVVGAVTVVVLVSHGTGIHDGPGTATITWVPVAQNTSAGSVGPAPQPFTGDIAGHPVTGTSTLVIPSGTPTATGSAPTGATPIYRYRGTFAGSSFDLAVSFAYPMAPGGAAADTAAALAVVHFTVSGTYGHSAVHAMVSSSYGVPSADRPARLTGTIGHWRINGTISPTTGTSAHRSVTAHFVVRG